MVYCLHGYGLREGDRFKLAEARPDGWGSNPWTMCMVLGWVILTQSTLRMAVLEREEGQSMRKASRQFALFVFYMVETIMVILINIVSSVLPSV